MSDMNTIQEQLAAAVSSRKDSLKALRSRIADLLEPIPIGTKLSDDKGLVCRVARVCTGASQWSNRTWDVTIKGTGYLSESGRLIAENLESRYFDGNNVHYRSTEPTCLGSNVDCVYASETGLAWLSGRETRELAARLPEAIARYMQECENERAANMAVEI